jgi:hypothetical protein
MLVHPFSGEKFRVVTALMGVDYAREHRVTVIIPADAIIQVVSGPRLDNTRMVDVRWEGRLLTMFVQDILGRCQRFSESAATFPRQRPLDRGKTSLNFPEPETAFVHLCMVRL